MGHRKIHSFGGFTSRKSMVGTFGCFDKVVFRVSRLDSMANDRRGWCSPGETACSCCNGVSPKRL